jgi:hypothetical protein
LRLIDVPIMVPITANSAFERDAPEAARAASTSLMKMRCVSDVACPSAEPGFESSLIERWRLNWSVPVGEISNYAHATFICQRITLSLVVPKASRRLSCQTLGVSHDLHSLGD